MPVKLKCPGCQNLLSLPDQARGKNVKCPSCGNAIKVPAAKTASAKGTSADPAAARAPRKRSKPAEAEADDDDFLNSIDLNRLEDTKTRVCPRCGKVVSEEDIDCPSCGADLQTGGLGTAQRARLGRKGAAPSEFYKQAAKNAGSYLMSRQGLVWKTVIIFTVFNILNLLASLMQAWCYHVPPLMFWGFIIFITGLISPGWIWYLQTQFINRMLFPKEEKRPFRFEPATCIALGFKWVIWSFVFTLPIALVGGVGRGMEKAGNESGIYIQLAAGVLSALFIAVCWPIVQAHMAMPVTSPGWQFWKVLPDVKKNIGPSLYWVFLAFVTLLPAAGVVVGVSYFVYEDLIEISSTLQADAQVLAEAEAAALQAGPGAAPPSGENAKRPEIPWSKMLWPCVAIFPISIAIAYWAIFNLRSAALFVKLFRPNIDLISQEAEYTYKARTKEEREKAEQQGKAQQAVLVSAFLFFALGLAGGMVYATFSGGGYGKGLGFGLLGGGGLLFLMETARLFPVLKDKQQVKLRGLGMFLGVVIAGIGGMLLTMGGGDAATTQPAAAPAGGEAAPAAEGAAPEA